MTLDRTTVYIVTSLAAVIIGFIVWIVFMSAQHSTERQKLMPDCEYLGEPKYLRNISFFDCNGTIVLKRFKK